MKLLRAGLASLVTVALAGCFNPTSEGFDAGGIVADTLNLSPNVLTLPSGTDAQLTLTVTGGAGNTRDATSEATWTVEPAGAVTVSAGKVHAISAGSVTVTATLNEKTARALVTVPTATIASIAIDPALADTNIGGSVALAAVATMSDQSRLDVTASAQFSVTPANVASIGNDGVLKALAAGKAIVTATVAGKTANAAINVRDAKLLSISVSPDKLTLPLGGQAVLRATGTYDDGLTADLTLATTWSSSDGAVEVDLQGRLKARAAGTADITATFQGFTAKSTISVSAATVASLTVSPSALNLAVGGSGNLTVEARFSDGSTSDFTDQAVWSSSEPAKVAVSNSAGSRGKVGGLNAGTATVTARFGSITAAAAITVTASTLQSIALTPSPASVVEESTLQFTASGTYSDGTVADVTSLVSFSSLSSSILSITPAGKATGVLAGTTQVVATLGGVMAQVQVTVTPNPVLYVTVLPGNITLQPTKTSQLRAMARRLDNTLRDVTELATWTTTNATFATVSDSAGSKGLARAVSQGTVSIEATFQALKGTATVNVSAPTVVAMSVNPPSLRMPVGFQYLSATLAMSDGSTQEVGDTAVWSSSDPSIAEVTVYQGYPYVEGKVPGTVTITATKGSNTANCQVIVTNATLTQIQITPATSTLQLGASERFVATGVYSDFSTVNLSYYATWVSSSPAVAGVDNSEWSYERGKVTALTTGTTTISVTYEGVTGSRALTVSPATLSRIQVAPFAPSLPVGFETYLRATGIYSDNTTRDLSYDAAWTSSTPSIGSVDPYGRLTPHQAGTTTIRATYSGVVGTTDVTVTNATLTGITITGGNTSIAVQDEQLLHAMGTFSDGTSFEVTWYVTWLSSTPAVADVRNDYPYNGQLKGLSQGSTVITAVRGSVQSTINVTVP